MNRPLLSFLATAMAAGLFFFLCVTSASDPQGSIVFFLLGPILFGLQAAALLTVWKSKAGTLAAKIAYYGGIGFGVFYLGFYLTLFTPGLQGFPKTVVERISSITQ